MTKVKLELPANDPAPRDALTYLLVAPNQTMIKELFRRLALASYDDISPAHGTIFRYVDSQGARLTAIAEQAHITKQSVGYLVDMLESRGYVERVPDPADRRAKIVRLSERGVECERTAIAFLDEIEAEWAELIGGEEVMAELRRLLKRLVTQTGSG